VYQALVEQSDVFVGIYWKSYGWVAPEMEISGVEDEYLLSEGKPRLIYIKDSDEERDSRLVQLLERIKGDKEVTYQRFRDAEELRELLANDLGLVLAERFLGAIDASVAGISHLPISLTPLIGRIQALTEITDQLARDSVRLVTLTGTGGVGKTRLALEAGQRLQGRFADGAAFVDLASVTDPSLVPAVILQALGLRGVADQTPMRSLRAQIADKQLLLVLDNFEHLLDAAPVVTELLANGPQLKILVTSRAPLRVDGEHEFQVDPMEVPDVDALPPLEALSTNESVAFFVERAQAVRPAFQLDDSNALAVAKICVLLDGLPLAIELAAAQIRLFPEVAALLARLQPRLPMLTGGRRDAPARQQTMRDAIDWSYDLLDAKARALFRRLGVFGGGWTTESAEVVANAVDPTFEAAFDSLGHLVEASLVRVEPAKGEPRFRMLETVREYALEQLDQCAERAAAEQAFVTYFVDLTLALAKKHGGTPHPEWMDQLEAEIDNLRSALTLAASMEDPNALVRLAWNLWRFWNVRGYLTEGRGWLDRALARAGGVEEFIRTDLIMGVVQLAHRQRDYATAQARLQELLGHVRTLRDVRPFVGVLFELSTLAADRMEFEQAASFLDDAETISREAGYRLGELQAQAGKGGLEVEQMQYAAALPILEPVVQELRALGSDGDEATLMTCLHRLGQVAHAEGNRDKAIALTEESLAIMDKVKETRGRPNTLLSLARMYGGKGDLVKAADLRNESLRLGERLEDPLAIAIARLEQGRFDSLRLNPERQQLLRESLATFFAQNDPRGVVESLEGLAVLALESAPGISTVILSAVETIRERIDFPFAAGEVERHQQRIVYLRATLGDEAFAATWATARDQPIEATIKLALGDTSPNE
jgi:predicted ATPase